MMIDMTAPDRDWFAVLDGYRAARDEPTRYDPKACHDWKCGYVLWFDAQGKPRPLYVMMEDHL